MKSWVSTIAMVTLLAVAQPAFAYSIYPSTTTPSSGSSDAESAASTQPFDFGSAWNELSTPFANFLNNLENVQPTDLPNQPPAANPSTQLQSIIPKNSNAGKIFDDIVNFLSWLTGWLILLADRLAEWMMSAIH